MQGTVEETVEETVEGPWRDRGGNRRGTRGGTRGGTMGLAEGLYSQHFSLHEVHETAGIILGMGKAVAAHRTSGLAGMKLVPQLINAHRRLLGNHHHQFC